MRTHRTSPDERGPARQIGTYACAEATPAGKARKSATRGLLGRRLKGTSAACYKV
jgi:hypothetical protein